MKKCRIRGKMDLQNDYIIKYKLNGNIIKIFIIILLHIAWHFGYVSWKEFCSHILCIVLNFLLALDQHLYHISLYLVFYRKYKGLYHFIDLGLLSSHIRFYLGWISAFIMPLYNNNNNLLLILELFLNLLKKFI